MISLKSKPTLEVKRSISSTHMHTYTHTHARTLAHAHAYMNYTNHLNYLYTQKMADLCKTIEGKNGNVKPS